MVKVTVVREVVPEPQVKEVVLTMTSAEAVALIAVLGYVCGDPKTTRCGLINNIYYALIEQTLPNSPWPDVKDHSGSGVYFS